MPSNAVLAVAAAVIVALGLGLGLGLGLPSASCSGSASAATSSSSSASATCPGGGLPKRTSPKKTADEVLVVWYKPHYQCGASAGSTPDEAAAFINAQLSFGSDGNGDDDNSNDDSQARDFVGVGEWAPTSPGVEPLGNVNYGSVAAVCGYGSDEYLTPVVLFHDRRRWDVLQTYPSSPTLCRDKVFLPPWDDEGIADGTCADRTGPTSADCCSCTYSEAEYALGDAWGNNLGQRPWAAGIYRRRSDGREVCVVAGEFPHPLANVTLWDLNGQSTWSSGSGGGSEEPYTIMPYVCTTQYSPDICVPNLDGASVVFGTDVFVRSVAEFCQDREIIVLADTNAGMGDFASSKLIKDPLAGPFSSVLKDSGTLQPYTCCNDTSYDGGMNRYASDRIMVLGKEDASGGSIQVNDLEGGSVAPGGPLPEDLPLVCHAEQEHAPLRAYISLPLLEG